MTTFVLCCCGLGVLRLSVMNELEEKVTNGGLATTRVKRFSVTVKSNFRMQPQLHLRGLSPRTMFYTKLHYYYHTNKGTAFWFYEIDK